MTDNFQPFELIDGAGTGPKQNGSAGRRRNRPAAKKSGDSAPPASGPAKARASGPKGPKGPPTETQANTGGEVKNKGRNANKNRKKDGGGGQPRGAGPVQGQTGPGAAKSPQGAQQAAREPGPKSKVNNKSRNRNRNNKNKNKPPDERSSRRSLARQVFEEPLMRLGILNHLNPFSIEDMKAIVGLRQLGLLPTDDLRYYLRTCLPAPLAHEELFTDDEDDHPFVQANEIMAEMGVDIRHEEYFLHEKMDDFDLKEVIRNDVLSDELLSTKLLPDFSSERKWLKKKKRGVIWRKYGFLSYIPKRVYLTIRAGQQAQAILDKGSLQQLGPLVQDMMYGDVANLLLRDVVKAGGSNKAIDVSIRKYGALAFRNRYGERHGLSILQLAAVMGHTATLKHLVERHDLDPMEVTLSGEPLSFFAAGSGRIDTLRYVIETLGVGVENESIGQVVMLGAVLGGNAECVKYLADVHGIDVSEANARDQPLAPLAAEAGKLELLRVLVDEYNVSVHAVYPDGSGCLHVAMSRAHVHMLEPLVETYKLDVNAKNASGMLPFHSAVLSRSKEAVRMLIEKYGVDPKAVTKCGATAAHFAARSKSPEMLKLLLDTYKLDPKAKTSHGESIMTWAENVYAHGVIDALADEYGLDSEIDHYTGLVHRGLISDDDDDDSDYLSDDYDYLSREELVEEMLYMGVYTSRIDPSTGEMS